MNGNRPNDKERIDEIPRSARVLGTDAEGRHHLYHIRYPTEVWVVDADGQACLHYAELGERSLVAWALFVADECGWDRRHHIEKPAGADLFDPEPTPPTREEVLA
jgi:hypothetical protein